MVLSMHNVAIGLIMFMPFQGIFRGCLRIMPVAGCLGRSSAGRGRRRARDSAGPWGWWALGYRERCPS